MLGFLEGAPNRGLFSNPTIYTTSLSLDGDQPLFAWWWVTSLPHHFFCSILLYSIHFSSDITICFKNGIVLLCFRRELHAEIWSRRFFPPMWNPNIKAINIIKPVQMSFNPWFGYSECVSYLLCGIMLMVLQVKKQQLEPYMEQCNILVQTVIGLSRLYIVTLLI